MLAGDFNAGAVKEVVYCSYEPRGLKVMAFTPMLSQHLFVARSDLDPELIQALRHALYYLRDSARGQASMRGTEKAMTGMVPAQDADYHNLHTLLRTLEEQPVP